MMWIIRLSCYIIFIFDEIIDRSKARRNECLVAMNEESYPILQAVFLEVYTLKNTELL